MTTRRTVDRLTCLRHTPRGHYAAKRKRFVLNYPNFYDRDLRKLFSDASVHAHHSPAARFLARIHPGARRLVARWTGEYPYRINQVLNDMIERCDQLQLGLASPAHEAP